TNNTLLITGGLATNSGTINLTGGTFDNNGHPLTNNGEISGYGTFRTGGLTNAPGQVITFTGGLATVNGPVTNSAGATIRANSSAGSYINTGGSLAARNVVNDGSFTQSAGNATMLSLSGTGSTSAGGGAGAAAVSVASLSQGAVTVNAGGMLSIRFVPTRLT